MYFSDLQSLSAFLGHYFLLCAFILWISGSLVPAAVQRALLAVVFLLLLIPISGLPIAGYIRGFIGDLSITSMILLAISSFSRIAGGPRGWNRAQRPLLAGAAVAGLLLYPFALGLTRFDSYQLGFNSPWLLLTVFVLVLVSWKTCRPAAVILLCATASFNLQLLESTNLWDYLIDPCLAFFAWGWAIFQAIPKRVSRPKPELVLSVPQPAPNQTVPPAPPAARPFS
jgi:hypothetical protein